jgi:enamine deaminase RidA (YjgF/YER057c/UK114 family)
MTIQRLNPEGLHTPLTYSQVVIATGTTMVFVAGQVSLDADASLVAPDDLAGQARQAYRNLATALEAAGATPADVVKLTTYVVGHQPEYLTEIMEARRDVLGDVAPASTLVGVQALARPEYLVEIEATAVISPASG